MKRLHIHLGVKKLEDSIRFYSDLFGRQPDKSKEDYAKWMLDDPRINFAISTRSASTGVDHLGLQLDSADELDDVRNALEAAGIARSAEGETTCCYAVSDKSWTLDPQGVPWEIYHTMEDAEVYSEAPKAGQSACCATNGAESACC
ncbi:MAG: VOC family protein [Leptospiraceae bacterium]|nr:VOC family protein [Leptospiraceae bacterium]